MAVICQVEGKLRYIANPHSEKRMKLILEQRETKSEILATDSEGDDEVDETTYIYYGEEACKCSKSSTCKSSKCICFVRGKGCNESCNKLEATKCKNRKSD